MPLYSWSGTTADKEFRKGEMRGRNMEAVRENLRRMKIVPVKIRKKRIGINLTKPSPKAHEVIVFTRQFAIMVEAGMPVAKCLETLAEQEENQYLAAGIGAVRESVEGGVGLAEAMAGFKDLFDDFFINMVAAGEKGSVLDVVLKRLADHKERSHKLKKKLKGAMIYPALLLGAAAAIITAIFLFVIPVFQNIFAGFGGSLPLVTQVVIDISRFIREQMPLILVISSVAAASAAWLYRRDSVKDLIDRGKLGLPVFGKLFMQASVARFARTMETLLKSEVSILESLDIAARTCGNRIMEKTLYTVHGAIVRGGTFSSALRESGLFPAMVSQMTAVGESTGTLGFTFEKTADFYDDRVAQSLENISSIIEPLMMMFMGLSIGGLVVSIYLPIFEMAGNFL